MKVALTMTCVSLSGNLQVHHEQKSIVGVYMPKTTGCRPGPVPAFM